MSEKIPLEYIANLSCLALEEDEMAELSADMADIINLMDTIKEIDVGNVPITEHISGGRNVMRDDTLGKPMDTKEILSNATAVDNCFVVPKMME